MNINSKDILKEEKAVKTLQNVIEITESPVKVEHQIQIKQTKRMVCMFIILFAILLMGIGFYFTMIYCPKCKTAFTATISLRGELKIDDIHTFNMTEVILKNATNPTDEKSFVYYEIRSPRRNLEQTEESAEQLNSRCISTYMDILNSTMFICEDALPFFHFGEFNKEKMLEEYRKNTEKDNSIDEDTLRYLSDLSSNEIDTEIKKQFNNEVVGSDTIEDDEVKITFETVVNTQETVVLTLEELNMKNQKEKEIEITETETKNAGRLLIQKLKVNLRKLGFLSKVGKAITNTVKNVVGKANQITNQILTKVVNPIIKSTINTLAKHGETIGKVVGGVAGGVAGFVAAGPAGIIPGAMGGAKIGGQIGLGIQTALTACPPQYDGNNAIKGLNCSKKNAEKALINAGTSLVTNAIVDKGISVAQKAIATKSVQIKQISFNKIISIVKKK